MMALSQVSKLLNGTMSGEDVSFSSVSIDTRNMQAGNLYIALHGENFDGHDYLEQAQQAGAVAAIVHKNIETDLPFIKVDDTRKALGGLAAAWRQMFGGKVVGITGSNGKTTVKEMVAAIVAMQGEVLATRGNFNNDIGLPLTLLRMEQEEFAVIEMGANHSGEISGLTHITQPDIAVITNAGPAHLEGFGSIEGVATAKAEIFEGLSEQGIAVINMDDEYSDYWYSLNSSRKTIGFSMRDASANIYGQWQPTDFGGELVVQLSNNKFTIQLNLFGLHNGLNALAAIAVAYALDISVEKIVTALNAIKPVKGRLNVHHLNKNLTVIDDTYNANPASLAAGIEVLKKLPGKHWLVLGDMGELGAEERCIHFDAGMKASSAGVHKLLAVGNASKYAVDAFGEHAIFFSDKNELLAYINKHQSLELGLLIKGSRFMHMETIVDSLTKPLSGKNN